MRNIFIFEPHASGHRLVYVRYLLAALEWYSGLKVMLMLSERDHDHPQARQLATEFPDMLRLVHFNDGPKQPVLAKIHPRLAQQFRYIEILRRALAANPGWNIGYVFIPFVDDYGLVPLALSRRPFGGLPWGGIVVRPRYHQAEQGYAPRRLADRLERVLYGMLMRAGGDLRQIFTIDPYFAEAWATPRLKYVPDPAEMEVLDPAQARARLGFSESDRIVLVYGHLDHRKGIPDLLRAVSEGGLPDSVKLLLAGLQHADIRALLDQPPYTGMKRKGQIVEIDRVVSDAEESLVFSAADLVWVYYPGNYGPSGVLVRAGLAGKAVICSDGGFCARTVAGTRMGLVVAGKSASDLADALRTLVRDDAARYAMGQAGRKHFSTATPAQFAAPIVDGIIDSVAQAPAGVS